MKFSGALHDAAGKPLSGTVDVTFSLYSTEAGGESLWFETQSVQADDLGRYTALLGAMHTDGLPIELFTSGEVRWLGIQVGLEAEQQPRVLLVSVPYALKAGDAETLGGKPASAYMLSDLLNGSTSTTGPPFSTATTTVGGSGKTPTKSRAANTSPLVSACSRVGSDTTAAVNSIAMFTTAICTVGGSAITQSGGNIGIGTAAPGTFGGGSGTVLDVIGSTGSVMGIGSSQSSDNVVGDFNFYNTAIGSGDQRIALIRGNRSGANNSGALQFFTRNAGGYVSALYIAPAGNIGIGTVSPSFKLDLLDNNPSLTGLHFKNPNSGGSALIEARLENDAGAFAYEGIASSGFVGFAPLVGGKAFWMSYLTDAVYGNQTVNNIIFTQNGNEIARFDTSGRLGIGTATPAATLEVNGTGKFDNAVTFAPSQTFPGAATLGANLFIGNQGVTGNLSATGRLFVGSGTPSSLPLEIQAGGQDALTVDSTGTVSMGQGSAAHITTASANTDFAGGTLPGGGGSRISVPAYSTASAPVTFATPFLAVPACVVTPFVLPGSTAPTAGLPTWYITYQTSLINGATYYSSFVVNLTSANQNPSPITFNYSCVGNPS